MRQSFAAGFILVFAAGTLSAGDLARERRDAFAWLDGLGYPDVKKLEFIRAATGNYFGDTNPPEAAYAYGFLIEAKGKTFKMLGLDMRVHDYTKTAGGPPHRQIYYDFGGIEAYSKAVVKALERDVKQEKGSHDELWKLIGGPPRQVKIFTLAAWCARHGHADLAIKLYDYARDDRYAREHGNDPKADKSVQERVADVIAHQEMWKAVLAFENPDFTRKQLLVHFERIVKYFPNSPHRPRAAETAAVLTKMIKEDEEHRQRRVGAKAVAQLPRTERIAELIFALRDQTGVQFSQPGACDIFWREGPARELVDIGADAVAPLIDVLDDERFSRAVQYHRSFYFSHEVLTVGECARQILHHSTGTDFRIPVYTKGMKLKNERERPKLEARAWYAEMQKKK